MNPYQTPMYQTPYYQQPRQYVQNNTITWVQGIEGAKAFQLSPNSTTLLMDSENEGTFYIKISDNVGMCNLRTFKYKEVTNQASVSSLDLSQYVRKDELSDLLKSILGGSNEQSISTVTTTESIKTDL